MLGARKWRATSLLTGFGARKARDTRAPSWHTLDTHAVSS